MAIDAPSPAIALVVLLASAGGLASLSIVLGDLPADFPAALVVQQHLGGRSSVLPSILGGRTPHRVGWARDGQSVGPGQVLVCPPDMHMEFRPGGTCSLRRAAEIRERRFDVLLASLAQAYGARGLAVVLSGSGRDGAEGTAAMKRACAVVIAESPDTAEYPSMPVAAARAGADLALPVHQIGTLLVDIVNGHAIDPNTLGAEVKPMRSGEASAGNYDRPTRASSAPNSLAARAEAARLRAAELRRRRLDLAAGRGATAKTVAIARHRAEQSLRRARQAHQAAEDATRRLAD